MSESYGPWHKLMVSWFNPLNDTWTEITQKPIPEELKGEVDIDYTFEHPEDCGSACRLCGDHPQCGIDWDISQAGVESLLDGDLNPGDYRVRHCVEVYNTWDSHEVTTYLEVEKG